MDFKRIIDEIVEAITYRPDEFWAKKTDEFFNTSTSTSRRQEIIDEAKLYVSHPSYDCLTAGSRSIIVEGFIFRVNDAQLLSDGFMYAGTYSDVLSKRKIILLSSILFTDNRLLKFFVAHEIGHCVHDRHLLFSARTNSRIMHFKGKLLHHLGIVPREEYLADKFACSAIGKYDSMSALFHCLAQFKFDIELSKRIANLVNY